MTCTALLVDVTGTLAPRLARVFGPELAPCGPPVALSGMAEAVARSRPGVVLLEVAGPTPLLVRAVEKVMAETPVPIVLVGLEGAASRELLGAGAMDLLGIPDLPTDEAAQRLRRQVLLIASVPVVKHPRLRRRRAVPTAPEVVVRGYPVVAIAASLGGPRALVELLRGLRRGFAAPVVIAQHITPGFSDDLATWLQAETGHRVHQAADKQALARGEIFLSPSHVHMMVQPSGVIRLDDGPPVGGFKPSCDVLLKSVALSFGARAVGVVLTGMGRDGAQGLQEIRARGGHTVAQDEASCVVFGMPGEAVALGAAEKVLPLAEIAEQLTRWVS